jgi:hypothetical protein
MGQGQTSQYPGESNNLRRGFVEYERFAGLWVVHYGKSVRVQLILRGNHAIMRLAKKLYFYITASRENLLAELHVMQKRGILWTNANCS